MENGVNTTVVEALILSSPEPLPGRKIIEVLSDLTPGKIGRAVADLNNRYMEAGNAFRIREIAGGYQFYVVPEFAGFVQELFTRTRKMRLTRAALETLAITAYRQPVTKAEIEHIRGVASDGVIHNLLQKNLLTIRGRADTVGKPLQYGTTDEFLQFFGLASLAELPKMSEIEELIKAREPQDQTELPLAEHDDPEPAPVKLNIVDGTYTPPSEDEDCDDDEGAESAAAPPQAVSVASDDSTRDEVAADQETHPSDDAADDADSAEDAEPVAVIVDMDVTEKPE